jgi:two-component system, NtrC family, nitrogen regulation response regulator GlnG
MPQARRILVVDDERDICEVMEEVLRLEGYEVLTVQTGAEALAAARDTSFDCAIIDLRLPGMSGLEVLDRLRFQSPQTAGIVLTASLSAAQRQDAIARGAVATLEKPVDFDQFFALLNRLWAGRP